MVELNSIELMGIYRDLLRFIDRVSLAPQATRSTTPIPLHHLADVARTTNRLEWRSRI
jgi:hypothetical protein